MTIHNVLNFAFISEINLTTSSQKRSVCKRTVFLLRSLAICVKERVKCHFLAVLQVQNLLRRITVVIPQQELEGRSELDENAL